ncbi:hypothetical protein ACFTXJ_24755 [Streptomyces zhihengii]|uniref:hypothetical protein n=1 Tax=Streptomyces zhihengii TaxID=1818004 RepID=UPI0036374012
MASSSHPRPDTRPSPGRPAPAVAADRGSLAYEVGERYAEHVGHVRFVWFDEP